MSFLNVAKSRVIHVSKLGNDANDGSLRTPMLTIQAAVTAAAALTPAPSATDYAVVRVVDGELYNETVTCASFVHIHAPKD